ncbi:MAG TPA: carboxypeptidase regulatory-like domain-containing protein [Vicinamibacterales bacterium]|jgi:plastocyanin
MRALAGSAAIAFFAVSGVLPRPAASFGLPASVLSRLAPRASPLAGAIVGRVDVRVAPSADVRPDPAALGMGNTRDALDRRRSVVYLESAPRAAFESGDRRHARMDQRNERFVPHILAVTTGTSVDFPNDDKTYHNVFSLSKAREFNLGRYAVGHSESVLFDQPGIVRVFCEIHSHMSAFILVFAHRYFAVTGDDGRYQIDGVPAGTYTLMVWNEAMRGDAPRRAITVGDAARVDADFTIR